MAEKPNQRPPRFRPVSGRFDPRVEPDDEDAPPSEGLRHDRVSLSGRPPMSALGRSASLPAERRDALAEPATSLALAAPDPRLEALEPLIARGDWAEIARNLGPLDSAGNLPPQLGLMYAIARNEAPSSRSPGSDADADGSQVSDLALRCVAAVCGVPATSGFALIIAKRLLRRNPVALRAKQAPPARTSMLIVLFTLLAGGAVGYLLSSGSLHLPR